MKYIFFINEKLKTGGPYHCSSQIWSKVNLDKTTHNNTQASNIPRE